MKDNFRVPFFYNLYFIFVNGKTFKRNLRFYLKKHSSNLDLSSKLEFQKNAHDRIFNIALKNFSFPSEKLIYTKEDQNSFITKDFYRKNFHIFKSFSFWQKTIETSGSTGTPLKIIRSPQSFINSQISFYMFFNQFDLNRFDKNIYIGGARPNSGYTLLQKIKAYLYFLVFNQYKFVSADLNTQQQLLEFINFYESHKPIYLSGFSSALIKIANFIKSNNISLRWKPLLIHPTAEAISKSQRDLLSEVFNAPTKMVYGATECHMASECPLGVMHLNMENCSLDLTKDSSALLTVFNSDKMPFVNYKIGDLLKISKPKERCVCGKHSLILEEVIGRDQDFIELRSGDKFSHPDLNMLIGKLDKNNKIVEYQIVHIEDNDEIEIRLINEKEFDLDAFKNNLNERFPKVKFDANNLPFIHHKNGKKPVIAKINLAPKIRETFNHYKPYEEISDSQKEQSYKEVLKLDWNESTLDFPLNLKEKAIKELSVIRLNHYPDLRNERLKNTLSKYLNLKKNCLTIFNGSDSGIATICRLFIEPEDSVVTINPTYGNYNAIASRYTKNVLSYELDYPFEIDISDFKKYIKINRPKLIFIPNPNNPTGAYIEKNKLNDLAENFKDICFVIDEAYVEFLEGKAEINIIPDNMIVLRTFSKAWGLAGIRLGYSLSGEELSNKLSLSRDNKEVDTFAQIVGTIAIENPAYMIDYVGKVKIGKKMLIDYFESNKIPYLSGVGNFILFKVNNPNELEKKLKEKRIFIRNRTKEKNLEGFLRVTVGDFHSMKKFIDELSNLDKYI
ncbi:MAG: pyridoxal phosphate-dependent aminotransferase [Gammaproteobacteria bacterium]